MPRRVRSTAGGIACPKCSSQPEGVVRVLRHEGLIRRKRRCACGHQFSTVERLCGDDPVQDAIDGRSLALAISILQAHQDSLRNPGSPPAAASDTHDA